MKKCVWFCVFVLFANGLKSQDLDQENLYKSDTFNLYKVNSLIIPILGYTPTTKLAIGGGGQFFFRTKGSDQFSRISNIIGTVIFTTEKQLMVDAATQIYFKNERYLLDGKFAWKKFPNTFYGIGNATEESSSEQYNMDILELHATFLKRLPTNVNFGFKYMFRQFTMKEVAEGGLLDGGDIIGADGANLHGLGMVLNIDNRDDYLEPRKGVLLQFNSNFTSRVLGSNYAFNEFIFDLRKFFPVSDKSVLGLQGFLHLTFGDVPFQVMPQIGGANMTRGYRKGRYRDENMMAFQAEYRYNISPRIKLAGFISTGEVAGNTKDFFSRSNYSYGGGFRWQIKKNNRALIRLDYGRGRDNSSGIYFSVNEAF